MTERTHTPFESIESTHEYLGLVLEALEEAKASVARDLGGHQPGSTRRADALLLTQYKLHNLERRLVESRRLLNDLRSLRIMLLGERGSYADDDREPEAVRVAVPALPA